MWQPGETTNFRASDHVQAILRHCGRARGVIDVCVVNTGSLPNKLLNPYQARSAQPVESDTQNLSALGLDVLCTDLLRMSARQRLAAGRFAMTQAPSERSPWS